jgi:hypothetical protein
MPDNPGREVGQNAVAIFGTFMFLVVVAVVLSNRANTANILREISAARLGQYQTPVRGRRVGPSVMQRTKARAIAGDRRQSSSGGCAPLYRRRDGVSTIATSV